MDNNKLIVTAAPHITSTDTTQKIMQRVCLALCPTLVAAVIIFGINALILTLVTVAACVFFEWGYCKLVHRPQWMQLVCLGRWAHFLEKAITALVFFSTGWDRSAIQAPIMGPP